MYNKAIFQGYLQFRNERSYQKMLDMYQYKMENFYKNDSAIDGENSFQKESCSFVVPRTVVQITKKTWNNTVSMFQYLSQFAMAGNVGAWLVEEGKILEYFQIEPQGDKVAVQAYLKGKKLSDEVGQEKAALDALSKAIATYDQHAQAYERRGYVNYKLGNRNDALYDFNKSIRLDEGNANAYYGRAKILIDQNKYLDAIEDLIMASRKSIALQPIYWAATRLRAECYIRIGKWEKAAFDLKLFTNRKFDTSNYNFKWKSYALLKYATVLDKLEDYKLALEALDKIEHVYGEQIEVPEKDVLFLRGKMKKQLGKTGFLKDLKRAAELGSKPAAKMLRK